MDHFKGTLMNDVRCSWTSLFENVYEDLALTSAYEVKYIEYVLHKDLSTIYHPVVFFFLLKHISHTTKK